MKEEQTSDPDCPSQGPQPEDLPGPVEEALFGNGEKQSSAQDWEAYLLAMEKAVQDTPRQLEELRQVLHEQGRQSQQAWEIVAECQRRAGEFLNRTIERHALHPAVLAAWTLAEELFRIGALASGITAKVSGCPTLQPLAEAAGIASQIAEDKLANLDAVRILPQPGDVLDAHRHEPCATASTEDQGRHGKVAEMITPGLEYRGEVLWRARVKVFRCGASVQAPAACQGATP